MKRFGLLLALGLAAALPVKALAEDLKVGITGPITGPNAAFGKQLTDGAGLAIENINAADGLMGKMLVPNLGDDVSDPKQGVSVANKFAGDGVTVVIGPFNSGVTIPASEIYAENGILLITPSATNPKVTERGLWNVFRTCGRDDQQGLVAGQHIAKSFSGKKIAFVHDKTPYGEGVANETRKAVNAAGIKEVLLEGVNSGDKDFSALVTKIKSSGADLVYWGGLHTEGGLLVRQLRDQGVTAAFMGADGIVSEEFANLAGPAAEGVMNTFPPDPRGNPAAKKIVDQFAAKGINPEAYTLYAYAAVEVYAQAAQAAQSTDTKAIAEKIHSGMTFKTVIGDFSYDAKGDKTKLDYVVYTWKKMDDGKITYVQNP